jgi:hypothetical protein
LYADQETVKFNFWLLKAHHAELQELAKMEGKSVAALIRELITSFLRDDNPNGRKK